MKSLYALNVTINKVKKVEAKPTTTSKMLQGQSAIFSLPILTSGKAWHSKACAL